MTKVHKYVLRRLIHEEYMRWLGQFGKNPITGLKKALDSNGIKYKTIGEKEMIISIGEKKLVIKQED
jgi:hypothetical protein